MLRSIDALLLLMNRIAPGKAFEHALDDAMKVVRKLDTECKLSSGEAESLYMAASLIQSRPGLIKEDESYVAHTASEYSESSEGMKFIELLNKNGA